jgi:hypothetical protein
VDEPDFEWLFAPAFGVLPDAVRLRLEPLEAFGESLSVVVVVVRSSVVVVAAVVTAAGSVDVCVVAVVFGAIEGLLACSWSAPQPDAATSSSPVAASALTLA